MIPLSPSPLSFSLTHLFSTCVFISFVFVLENCAKPCRYFAVMWCKLSKKKVWSFRDFYCLYMYKHLRVVISKLTTTFSKKFTSRFMVLFIMHVHLLKFTADIYTIDCTVDNENVVNYLLQHKKWDGDGMYQDII